MGAASGVPACATPTRILAISPGPDVEDDDGVDTDADEDVEELAPGAVGVCPWHLIAKLNIPKPNVNKVFDLQ